MQSIPFNYISYFSFQIKNCKEKTQRLKLGVFLGCLLLGKDIFCLCFFLAFLKQFHALWGRQLDSEEFLDI